MGSPLLPVSPIAGLLLDLAARKASGRLVIGDRTLLLRAGELREILPGPDDESLEHFLTQSGRLAQSALAQYEQSRDEQSRDEQSGVDERGGLAELLLSRGMLNAGELRQVRRSILLDRLTRGLRAAAERREPRPDFEPGERPVPASATTVPLLPLLLDALSRCAANEDAALVGAHLNHRLEWLEGAHAETARAWADIGEGPLRPAISTVLAKRPAAAPRIAALMRAGLVRLEAPGRSVASDPPSTRTLPPPPPRITPISDRAEDADPLASPKQPRLRLDPGYALAVAEPLEPTALPELPEPSLELVDPLLAIEQRIAELEARSASGAERARAFCALADAWRDRFGSVERACRAYREAASADPSAPGVLEQAAAHCHHLGQRELAVRYVDAAVAAAAIPIERASAQRLRAVIARNADDIDTCIEALCEAAADDPGNPDAHEQVAALLLERGQLDGANAHARLAATAIQDETPERALSLLGYSWSLTPHDTPTAYEYASLLDQRGLRAAAVAVLAHTASRTDDFDQRRKLRLSAAERAEAGGRPDIAAELLCEAFDAEPHFDLVYGPLDEDLGTSELVEYRAAVLEDIATACPDEQRAYWLTRAARTLLTAEGEHEAAVWLLFEALLTEPGDLNRLAELREHAASRRELMLLAHGLRAAIAAQLEGAGGPDSQATAGRLLDELAELARVALDNPHLALAALQQRKRLGEQDHELEAALAELSTAVEARRSQLEHAERALAGCAPEERPSLCREVAALLPDLPEHWPRVTQLLAEALVAGEEVESTRDALETLYGLSRDASALATFLEDQAELCDDRAQRVRLLARLAAVHTVREDAFAVAAVCEGLLAIDPGCRIAIARLERAARRIGDARRLAHALALRGAITRSARERARTLAQLARAEELAGSFAEAAAHAAEALREDAAAADAALLLLRQIHRAPPELVRAGLAAASAVCGPSRALLASEMQVAQALDDKSAQQAALDAWVALLPNDATAHRARLRFYTAAKDAHGLLSAAEAALQSIPSVETLAAARDALSGLESLAAWEPAARLALRIAEEQGKPDPELVDRARVAAGKSGSSALLSRTLELRAAIAAPAERTSALRELADHHRAQSDVAAETRALLRVLELEPGAEPADVLERLRDLLTTAGDGQRLFGVVNLLLARESEPERRRTRQLELATIAGVLLQDRERAEFHVRTLVAEAEGEPARTREALGALLTLGGASWALARCGAIAESCPPELGSRIYQWCAATAEQRLDDPPLALEIARRGALRWPAQAQLLLLVERLTLASDDTHTALEVYAALTAAAIGPHGRRALLYRAGRWLERAGLLETALERYLQAFELAPSSGAAFKAVERMARQSAQLARVLPCYELLAEHARDGRTRTHLLSGAAELCLRELSEPARGFALLQRANASTERYELDDRLLELAREQRARDDAAGTGALRAIAEELGQRAGELWNGEDKLHCLVRLANVLSGELGEHAAALQRLDEAQQVAAQEELGPAHTAQLDSARAEITARTQRRPPAESVLDLFNIEDVAPAPEPRPEPPQPPARAVPPVPAGVLRASEPELETAPPPTPRAPGETPADARERLRRLLELEPWRTDALRELYELCASRGERPAVHVLRQLLSRFDTSMGTVVDRAFHSGLWRGGALRQTIGDELSPELARFVATLWEYARVIPRYRKTLDVYAVRERDRISRMTVGPVAEAYAQAARMLDLTDVPVYVSVHDSSPARALPTHPPAVLAGRGAAEEPSSLLYAMAHAMWLAQPERVIGGVLPPEQGAELLRAAQLAFAPGLTQDEPTAATKELAAALWQGVPTRQQRQLSEVLRRSHAELDYAALRAKSRAAAARAALLTSGGLRFALHLLARVEPELAGMDLSSERQFAHACERSPALAETVRCALSEPFLAALAQAL